MEDTAAKRRMYLLLALTAVIWGIQPLCIKWLVAEWSPVTISAMRYIFISAALLVIAVRRGETLLPPRHAVHRASVLNGDQLHADCCRIACDHCVLCRCLSA